MWFLETFLRRRPQFGSVRTDRMCGSMRVENRSHADLKRLKPLVGFVLDRLPISADAIGAQLRFQNLDPKEPQAMSTGIAHSWHAEVENPLVIISIKNKVPYPFYTQHVREVPGVYLNNQEEELVLILAHEFQHIVQMCNGAYEGVASHDLEVDAERFAISVLDTWRSSQSRSKAA